MNLNNVFFSGTKSSTKGNPHSNVQSEFKSGKMNKFHDASNMILDHALHNNENSSNIKVYARFRPFNKSEKVRFFKKYSLEIVIYGYTYF